MSFLFTQTKVLGGDKPLVTHLRRPGGTPATIFNPVLATLQQRLDHLEQVQVSRPEVERAAKYILCTVEFHKDEAHQKVIKGLLDEAIGENGDWGCTLGWADNIKPDGAWWYAKFLILNLELKNRLGLSGDSLLQAVTHYSKVVSRENYERFWGLCNFPIVLVGATANRLENSVAVCVGLICVTKLLTLDFSLGFHASDNIIRLVRVFSVLSSCRADPQNHYDKVSNLKAPRLSGLYPSPTPASLSRAGQPTSALVDLGNTTSAMYIATLVTPTGRLSSSSQCLSVHPRKKTVSLS
ncbi:hypothetical protein NLJ89_g4771 [Agrocybe chaxingu]|uniref:Uncharacterized protein n=1 Tax=Agrocybe chaxingu TaxID=84603 RepID=A0A9W8K2K8_9AGAR|nr:hypothetical protein NLJ89_g4771 [Agrocybe chaxingu]